MKSTAFKILLGRFLTRSGDQAWDFAVPLTLLKVFPDQLRIAAGYFLAVKFMHVLLMPRIAAVIDRRSRIHVAYLGSILQVVGVFFGVLCLLLLNDYTFGRHGGFTSVHITAFIVLVFSGLISSLGSSLLNISVGNDLVPAAFDSSQLPQFNSRMRQLDLLTEVSAPVLAGLLLLVTFPSIPLAGFLLVAAWNLLSFFPEVLILRSIFKTNPKLLEKSAPHAAVQKTLLLQLRTGWTSFFKQPVAPAVLAYALLWLSVLSPHGVLLTGYLKDGLKMSEVTIGVFRGLGAVFGLFATLIFPIVVARIGLIKGSRAFILFQTATLICALIFFLIPASFNYYGFLALILLSRIGLYGFSLGEMQIRQQGISPHERGEVNGFSDALTGVATLALYVFGTLLPNTSDFRLLIIGSVIFVSLGALIFSIWKPKQNFESL